MRPPCPTWTAKSAALDTENSAAEAAKRRTAEGYMILCVVDYGCAAGPSNL